MAQARGGVMPPFYGVDEETSYELVFPEDAPMLVDPRS